MCYEDCDAYEPKNKKDKVCKHFHGNKGKQREISKCHYHCSYYDSISLMQGDDRQPLRRHKGALRR